MRERCPLHAALGHTQKPYYYPETFKTPRETFIFATPGYCRANCRMKKSPSSNLTSIGNHWNPLGKQLKTTGKQRKNDGTGGETCQAGKAGFASLCAWQNKRNHGICYAGSRRVDRSPGTVRLEIKFSNQSKSPRIARKNFFGNFSFKKKNQKSKYQSGRKEFFLSK